MKKKKVAFFFLHFLAFINVSGIGKPIDRGKRSVTRVPFQFSKRSKLYTTAVTIIKTLTPSIIMLILSLVYTCH